MERKKSNSSISEIFFYSYLKKNAIFFKFHFKSSIYAYAKPFIHFQGGWGGVLICINQSFLLFVRFSRTWPDNSPLLFSVSACRSQQPCWPNRLETAYLIPIEPRPLEASMLSSHLSISKITTILELSLSMWRIKVFLRPWISIGCRAKIQATYVKSLVCLDVYRNYTGRRGKKELFHGDSNIIASNFIFLKLLIARRCILLHQCCQIPC